MNHVTCKFVAVSSLSVSKEINNSHSRESFQCFQNLPFDLFLSLFFKWACSLTDIFKTPPFLLTVPDFVVLWGCSLRNLHRHDQQLLYKSGFQKLIGRNAPCVFSPHSAACQQLMQMNFIILQTQAFQGIGFHLLWWDFPLLLQS